MNSLDNIQEKCVSWDVLQKKIASEIFRYVVRKNNDDDDDDYLFFCNKRKVFIDFRRYMDVHCSIKCANKTPL